MTLLLRDTDTKADAPADQTPEASPAVAACPKCHAPLEPGQDWCLNCGEAQASRRVTLPGKRAAATVLALTTVLVGGAVAASYAALSDGSDAPAPTPTQVAQVPAPAPAPAAPVTPDPSAATPSSTTPPAASSTTPPSTTGTTKPPKVSSAPVTPLPSGTGTASTGSTGSTSAGSGTSTGSGTTTGSSKSDDTTADTRTSTTPAQTQPTPITLAAGAAALYDPFKRDTAAGDPSKALDGDPNTSFPVTVAAGSAQIGAGLTVDLGKKQGIREIDLTTKTPGFKVEIYATDETDLPPDVLDTRWAHLKDVTGVGADTNGKATVTLGAGTSKYRHVLLWFTAPPTDGSTVRVSELKLLG